MIQTAQNLNHQGEENKERVERLLKESQELANRDISGGLLDGLQEMIASIQGSLPQEVSANGVSQYIQAQEKELQEKQSKVNELLSHMNSLVTNQNDLSNLQALLQGSNQGLNFAANSAVSKYLDDYAKKLQKDNEERSANLQKTLLEALTNGDQYKYLREAGYGFRTDGEGISAYRQIHSGEIAIDGSAMKETSYSPELEYQYIRIETKFNPGNLSVDMMNPNTTRFNAEMVLGLKGYIDDLQKNVEEMFAQFSNKTEEIKEEYAQNQEIESYQKKLYEASKENYVAAFQGLHKQLGYTFGNEMINLAGYYEKNSQYDFGKVVSQKIPNRGTVAKNTKPNYDSLPTIDSTFTGDRELKGSVSIKGIPVEVNYGMQHLIFSEEFQLEKLNYNFNLKGLGMSYLDGQLTTVDQKYSQYSERVQSDIERQAKANDAERDSKGFLFNILNGMSGGQKVGEAIRSEVQGRVTGAIAEAVGLPSSFVGAFVGGGGMKQAIHAYEKSLTTQAISQATGVPAWYIDSQIAEKEENHKMASSFHYNMGRAQAAPVLLVAGLARGAASAYSPLSGMKKKADALNKRAKKFADHLGREAYENREAIDTAITVGATIAAPFTGGASLVGLTIYKAMEGAAEGGVLGALAGAATIGNAFLYEFTGGMVSYDLSYSYEDGFGASVGSGMKIVEGLGVGSTLSYNEQNGFGMSLGLQAGTSALSYNAGLSYSERDGISGSAGIGLGLGRNAATGSYSSTLNLGVSYNRRDGFGTSVGISRNNNVVMPGVGASISRSEYGGFGADITSNQYGQTEGAGGRPGFGGVSGGLSWSQRDGFTASFNVSGTNAFSYNSQTGLSSNSDFLSQYAMNNGLSQGVAQTDEEKAHAARVEAEERARAAQNRNNQESGAAAVSGAGVLTQRRDDNILDHILNSTRDVLGGAWDRFQGAVSGAWNGVTGAVSGAWDGVKNALGFGRPEVMPMLIVGQSNSSGGFGIGDALPEGYSVSHGNTGWERQYGGQNQSHVEYLQELQNGTNNRISEAVVNGERESFINGKLLRNGDGIVMDANGKLQVISQANLGKYIQENGITNAVVSTNGIANSALDATQMLQSIARHTNITDASQGQSGAVIHIFRDQKVSNAISRI
ncbi:hypothetical protein LEP1GSC168_4142 [Leptospira santarosai str. HAI134]|uniref:hypothetical protein n=1 Tax=Leptospira santarosai TaxID=28183 RepID=UPI0002BE0082|nr:hypothetical protein [Leptospira santarosai]EMO22896.1 hypothetical protein LEP1GSC168_4142 [Leptospira santarosai str. HAI134]